MYRSIIESKFIPLIKAPARESVPSVQVSAGSMSMLSAETRGNSERTDVSDGKQEGGQAGEAAGTGVVGTGKSHDRRYSYVKNVIGKVRESGRN